MEKVSKRTETGTVIHATGHYYRHITSNSVMIFNTLLVTYSHLFFFQSTTYKVTATEISMDCTGEGSKVTVDGYPEDITANLKDPNGDEYYFIRKDKFCYRKLKPENYETNQNAFVEVEEEQQRKLIKRSEVI